MSFLGIKINHDIARLLNEIDVPGKKVDTAELHITLLYLGQNTAIEELAKAMIATYEITKNFCPFWVKTSNLHSFENPENTVNPIIALIQSPKLLELNKQLKRSFNKHKVEYSKKFKIYNPHITLSFNEDPIKKTKIEAIDWSIQEIVLWGGDHGDEKVFLTFPLEIKKNCEIECETK